MVWRSVTSSPSFICYHFNVVAFRKTMAERASASYCNDHTIHGYNFSLPVGATFGLPRTSNDCHHGYAETLVFSIVPTNFASRFCRNDCTPSSLSLQHILALSPFRCWMYLRRPKQLINHPRIQQMLPLGTPTIPIHQLLHQIRTHTTCIPTHILRHLQRPR